MALNNEYYSFTQKYEFKHLITSIIVMYYNSIKKLSNKVILFDNFFILV